ncbi:methyltransferase [Utexia brackfieldae]|uniref:tRNA1(Val) (adenine(37)-N6)-methyltransferase n=1 Tax=Utexia brackfieldae TaxID=3074108 RepID=UPI00370D4253
MVISSRPIQSNGFTFKRFFVAHDKSPMKITTDSVLLAAWVPLNDDISRVLDIGTGCGVIALMLAQRLAHLDCQIEAIEIDPQAAEQCQENNQRSPFRPIHVIQGDVIKYADQQRHRYDLIISNPPYFAAAVACRDTAREHARYTTLLDHQQLLTCATALLKERGSFCLVLPWHGLTDFMAKAKQLGWFAKAMTEVKYNENKSFSLVLLCLVRYACDTAENQLCMRHKNHDYTDEFAALLQDFYLRF